VRSRPRRPRRGTPGSAQLRASLLAYAASPAFSPATTRTLSETAALFTPSLSLAKGRIATASSAQPDHQPDLAVDNDGRFRWCADGPGPAQWLAVDLGAVHDLSRVIIAWEQDRPGYRYRLEGSADGVTWQVLSDQTANVFPGGTTALNSRPAASAICGSIRLLCPTAAGPASAICGVW